MIENPEAFPWSPYPMFSTGVWTNLALDESLKMMLPTKLLSDDTVGQLKHEYTLLLTTQLIVSGT